MAATQQQPRLPLALALIALQFVTAVAGGGYVYSRPAPAAVVHSGHAFAALSTVLPLPPVPALPALPTPRPGGAIKAPPTFKSIAASYLPAHAAPSAPSAAYPATALGGGGLPPPHFQIATQQQQQQPRPAYLPPFGSSAASSYPTYAAPSSFSAPTAPTAPTALDGVYFGPKGRPLKQYAVVEIIDNDVEQQAATPFLPSGYFDSARAQVGASGTGATVVDTHGLRLNALRQQQQHLLPPPPSPLQQSGDTISLGSGGLGYVRLANGNVYLGSGSLGYISSQQLQLAVQEVRTRSEAASPDPLHFGHGPLGGTSNGFRLK